MYIHLSSRMRTFNYKQVLLLLFKPWEKNSVPIFLLEKDIERWLGRPEKGKIP